jgi:eukaryotic-like serine/threonine-protein kinase
MSKAPNKTRTGVLKTGATVGRYTVVREIGKGGMCRVYEAIHGDLGKTVALKVLNQQFMDTPVVVERFLLEGRNASKVRHRNAIEVFDVGEDDGIVFLAMEHLQGEDLLQRLKREGVLSVSQTIETLLPAMAALVEAHEAGVVHRDLKPANIFLARDRRGNLEVRVLDFGIAKAIDDDLQRQHHTNVGATIGTPLYLAPELVRSGRSASPKSDQFALGVVLYQCVTGRVPFRGNTAFETYELIVEGKYFAPQQIVASIPEDLSAVIARCLSSEAADRYPSLIEMGADLLPFATVATQMLWASTFGVALDSPTDTSQPLLFTQGVVSISETDQLMSAEVVTSDSVELAAATPMLASRDTETRLPSSSRAPWILAAVVGVVLIAAATAVMFQSLHPVAHVAATPATAVEPPPPVQETQAPAVIAVPATVPVVQQVAPMRVNVVPSTSVLPETSRVRTRRVRVTDTNVTHRQRGEERSHRGSLIIR